MHPATADRGFTLIETVAVLAVMLILASQALPNWIDFIERKRLSEAAANLATDLRWVRMEARARGEPLRVSVLSEACYAVHTGASSACRCGGTGEAAVCTGSGQVIKTVRLEGTGLRLASNVSSMAFDPEHGTVTPTATLRVIGPSDRAIHHIVNVLGRVRSCSPQGAIGGLRAC